MPAKRLVVFDPGETTGWAYVDLTECKTPTDVFVRIRGGAFSLWSGARELIASADAVIYETFLLRGYKARHLVGTDIPTLQVVGVIRAAAEERKLKVFGQAPVDAKRAFPDSLLQRYGLLDDSPHVRDAYRHLLLFLRKAKWQL